MERWEFEQLFRGQYADLVRLARYLTCDPSAAEDLAQEAFVRACGSVHQLRDAASAPAYLRAIVVNLCRAGWRRRVIELRHVLTPPETAPERDTAGRLDLHAALKSLPPRKRACVVLRYFSDLSESDTAELLGISVGTVKSQTSKALALLAVLLADNPADGSIAEGRPHA